MIAPPKISHDHRDAQTRRSAEVVLKRLRGRYPFESLIDVGCGVGTWCRVAREIGALGPVLGVDGPWVPPALRVCQAGDFAEMDFRAEMPKGDKFDVALCLEVGEHLPEERAPALVEALCSLSDRVLFSAAIPGQGGEGHVNEKWPDWWGSIFAGHGLYVDESFRMGLWNEPKIEPYYRQNLLLFERREIDFHGQWELPFRFVHPDLWLRKIRK